MSVRLRPADHIVSGSDRPARRLRNRAVAGALTTAALVPAAVLGLAGTAAAAPSSTSPASPAAASPADLSQQQVAAIAEAGTVYISGTWSGYVSVPSDSGNEWSPLLQANFSCSGFVASSDGYVVTAGHCADVAEGKKALVDEFLGELVQSGELTQADAQQLLANGAEDALPVEGKQAGSPPVLTTKVYPAIAIGGTGDFQGYDATLVDDRPLAQGDVALLKIDAPNPLPVLQVATAQPQPGDTVDAIGYPGNVTALVSGSVQPTFAKGQVSGRQQTDAGPFTQVGVSMSPGMSGGPVVNGQGQVIGTVSFGPSDDTQQLNFASTQDNVQALLTRNGVKNTLSATDVQYRKGLSEYFAGRFHAAAADLGAVVGTVPNQALAQQYKTKAIENFGNEKAAPAPAPKSSGLPVVWIAAGAGGLLVVGLALIALVLRRRRGNPGGTPTAPAPVQPVAPGQSAQPTTFGPSPVTAQVPVMWTAPTAPAATGTGGTSTALLEAPAPTVSGSTRYCPSCGSQQPGDNRFCAGCGHSLG